MALGPDLALNGDFSSGIGAGWIVQGESTAFPDVGTILSTGNVYSTLEQETNYLEIGKIYRVVFDVVSTSGAPIDNISGSMRYDTTTTGLQKEFDYTADSTALQFKRTETCNVVIDNVSVREILPTTTVEIEWIDSISAAVIGNKIYRDDVEIADIANGVQIYQDDTAETGTEYKYEVQAYSATDETTQEVLGKNMDYITTV